MTVDLDRHLPFASAFNVRDLGGYPTADGLQVRWRTVYRADGLHRLSEDMEAARAWGVRTVIDLRTTGEVEQRGRFPVDHLPVDYRNIPLIEKLWAHDDLEGATSAEDFLLARYLDMLEEGSDAIHEALTLLAEPGITPVVFHCMAGKDRTGVLAAILLSVLGVHPNVVADDYALSAAAMVRLNEYFVATFPDAVDAMAKQPKEFMAAPVGAMHRFLETMDQTYGSAEAYVRSIGIEDDTLSALRTALLEQP